MSQESERRGPTHYTPLLPSLSHKILDTHTAPSTERKLKGRDSIFTLLLYSSTYF